jgi:hypothetical protein
MFSVLTILHAGDCFLYFQWKLIYGFGRSGWTSHFRTWGDEVITSVRLHEQTLEEVVFDRVLLDSIFGGFAANKRIGVW